MSDNYSSEINKYVRNGVTLLLRYGYSYRDVVDMPMHVFMAWVAYYVPASGGSSENVSDDIYEDIDFDYQ